MDDYKPTIQSLAEWLGKTKQALYAMRKAQPKQFQLIWNGWLEMCKSK